MFYIAFIFGMVISFVLGAAYGYQVCVEHFKQFYANELMKYMENKRNEEDGEDSNR